MNKTALVLFITGILTAVSIPFLIDIVKDGELAGMGAHSYSKGSVTDGSEEAAEYKKL